MIRTRTLRPLRNGSATLTAKRTAGAYGSFFPKCFSNRSRDRQTPCPTTLLIWPCSWIEYEAYRVQPIHCGPVVLLHALAPSVYFDHRQGVRWNNASSITSTFLGPIPSPTWLGVRLKGNIHNSDNYRTDTEQSPDKHRTPRALVSADPIPLFRATLEGSTRLRTERPTVPRRNPLVPVFPQLLCFLWEPMSSQR